MFGFGKKSINELTQEELIHIQKELHILNDALVNANQLLLHLNNLNKTGKIERQRKIWASVQSFAKILYEDEIKSLELLREFIEESKKAQALQKTKPITGLARVCPSCRKRIEVESGNFCSYCGQQLKGRIIIFVSKGYRMSVCPICKTPLTYGQKRCNNQRCKVSEFIWE